MDTLVRLEDIDQHRRGFFLAVPKQLEVFLVLHFDLGIDAVRAIIVARLERVPEHRHHITARLRAHGCGGHDGNRC